MFPLIIENCNFLAHCKKVLLPKYQLTCYISFLHFMLSLLIKINLCLFSCSTHTKFLYTKKLFACGDIYVVQNILLWIIFYKDDIFQQSKRCNNFVLESNLISQFEENVKSFDFLAKALGYFKQIQTCFINVLNTSRMLMHSIYVLSQQSHQTRKGLYIQNYRYFTIFTCSKYLWGHVSLAFMLLLVKNLADVLLLLYGFSLSAVIVSTENILAKNSNDHWKSPWFFEQS